MRGTKRWLACLISAALLLSVLPAGAVEHEEPAAPLPIEEANGYIFALRDDAPVLFQTEDPDGVEAISAAHGVYRADTLEDIAAFVPEEFLRYVTPDYAVELHTDPDDPDYTNGSAWSLDMLNMAYAWENDITGKNVRVGIVDSGVRRTHEDIVGGNVLPGTYYPPGSAPSEPGTEEPDGPTKQTNAHGTFVAGLIGAVANNGKGIAGVAPGVELVPLVAFKSGTTYLSAVCNAIYGGVDEYHCDVINMSLGIYKDKLLSNGKYPNLTLLDEAIAYAAEAGVVLVASTGNDGGTMLSYPAAYPEVIGVGSVNQKGVRASSSQHNESVFVVAPGERVYSLSYSSDTGYSIGSGTSYAAPQVAAALALALELDPNLTLERLMDLMASTAVDRGDAGRDDEYGYGILNVSNFLEAAAEPWAEQRAIPGGVSLTAHYCHLTPGRSVTVLAAAYDANGRMVDVTTADCEVQPDGTLVQSGLVLDTTLGAVCAEIFLWDTDSSTPLASSLKWTLL